MTTNRKRIVLGAGVAGLAALGITIGGAAAANADGPSTPSVSASAPAAPSGAPSGTPSGAPSAAPATPKGTAPAAPKGGPRAGAKAPTPKPHIDGTVLSLSGSTLTVKDPEGFTRTIVLGSSVKVEKNGSSSSTSALTKGTAVHAEGSVDSNGTSLDATTVMVGMPTPPAGGPAAGGPGAGPAAGAKGAAPAKGGAAPSAPAAPSGTPSSTPTPTAGS